MAKRSIRKTPTVDDLSLLSGLPDPDLRARWEAAFKTFPPPGSRREFLAASLAYREQELTAGSLSAEAQKTLQGIARSLTRKASASAPLGPLKAGTRLLRTWQGERHEVLVLEKGFSYGGKTFGSLSEIARVITGARWSGPLFFGLKPPSAKRPASSGKRR